MEERPKGPMPTGKKYKSMPIPFFFHPSTADAFAKLQPVADDVFMVSLAKGGTTWVHRILHLLLHGLLHLAGFDHTLDDEAADMEKLESYLLSEIGIADPYQDVVHTPVEARDTNL